jgi:hypothetical protein
MKQFIRKNIYKWHKIIGLTTIIPVIFWCLSGLMHPFLSHWFKPKIANEFMVVKPLSKAQLVLPLDSVLKQNKITDFKGFRIIQFNGKSFYQIKNLRNEWNYYNTENGTLLKNGEKIYAEYLARFFLADSTSKISSITLQTEFDQQYKYINRLLPVWKVSFDRADKMDVYVETSYSRLGTFNPISRKIFLFIFDNFHNWSFLEKMGNNTTRIALMLALLSVICISTISGIIIYGLMWGKFKKPKNKDEKSILKKYHRQIGIAVSFVSLTFAFSGGYHATRKIVPNTLPEMLYEPVIQSHQINHGFQNLPIEWERLTNCSIVKINDNFYYQLFYKKLVDKDAETIYYQTNSLKKLNNGDFYYANYLGEYFQSKEGKDENSCCEMSEGSTMVMNNEAKLLEQNLINQFEKREYGFAFKRLPVIRLSYNTPQKTNYYIETSTSRLAAKIDNSDRFEGYSFAILHKFLFLDWAGKNVRDITMMISALGVLIVSIMGLILFFKK